MSAFADEQSDEVEVLKSIFPDEFEELGAEPWHFKLHLKPNDGSEEHVAVALVTTFPADYPSIAPEIDVEIEKGLGRKHVEELKVVIAQCAEDNLGMPSVFAIAEQVKEWLVSNNIPGQDGSMYAEMMRKEQQSAVENKKRAEIAAIVKAAESENAAHVEETPEELERIRRRQAGHPCTVESFNEWKAKFEAEMALKSVAIVEKDPLAEKMSGKQLFMLNKAETGLEEELLEESANAVMEEEPQLKNEADYEDFDDDDDDDDDDYVPGDDDDDDDDDT